MLSTKLAVVTDRPCGKTCDAGDRPSRTNRLLQGMILNAKLLGIDRSKLYSKIKGVRAVDESEGTARTPVDAHRQLLAVHWARQLSLGLFK